MLKGYLCLVLHGHLPYVRHPEHEDFLEEDWFYEAITETYIHLITVFERLARDKINFSMTMSLTPTLASMLMDSLLQERYLRHLNKLIELAHKEVERTRWTPEFQNLALMYVNLFVSARELFERYNRNLVLAFKRFQDSGNLEIITCGATHGYFPLMDVAKASIRAQVKVAVSHYEKIFDRKPKGMWLPECGYHPGDDEILKEAGIKYFFSDSHGVLHGTPRPKYGVFAPVYCKSGIACFARDMESSKQVWSSVEGYPGDYYYREFYRDIGFDLDYEYIRPYILPDGVRINTGIKYYRITGPTNEKRPYEPHMAYEKTAAHAGNFLFNREKQVEFLYDALGGRKPIIVAPYDAELYGHWWFEGPQWLEFLIRKITFDQKTIKLVTPSQYLAENPKNQVLTPSMSSWGWKGYSEVWLQGSNDWIYRHLHKASWVMTDMAKQNQDANGLKKRALNQALRELLLAQSSDWAFIMATGTHVSYAQRRTKDHLLRFFKLADDIKADTIDEGFLKELEAKDNIFPDIDYRVHQ